MQLATSNCIIVDKVKNTKESTLRKTFAALLGCEQGFFF